MNTTEKDQIPQLLIVPKEYGGIWLPILCFLLGVLNFGLIANITFHVINKNEIHQTKTERKEFVNY